MLLLLSVRLPGEVRPIGRALAAAVAAAAVADDAVETIAADADDTAAAVRPGRSDVTKRIASMEPCATIANDSR